MEATFRRSRLTVSQPTQSNNTSSKTSTQRQQRCLSQPRQFQLPFEMLGFRSRTLIPNIRCHKCSEMEATTTQLNSSSMQLHSPLFKLVTTTAPSLQTTFKAFGRRPTACTHSLQMMYPCPRPAQIHQCLVSPVSLPCLFYLQPHHPPLTLIYQRNHHLLILEGE